MNDAANKILSQMLEQFKARHKRPPQQIVISPLASLALAVKQSLAPYWSGIPVICRDVQEHEVATAESDQVRSLAVYVVPEQRSARLVATDLKT